MKRLVAAALLFSISLGALVALWLFSDMQPHSVQTDKTHDTRFAAKNLKPATQTQSQTISAKRPSTEKKESQNRNTPETRADVDAMPSHKIITSRNMLSGASLTLGLHTLKNRPRTDVVGAVMTVFRDAGTDNTHPRELALWFAKQLNGPDLLPLWKDVVYRTTPALENESDLLRNASGKKLNGDVSYVFHEQLVALNALGELAQETLEARTLLWDVALRPKDQHLNSLELRRTAVANLEAAGTHAILKLAYSLRADDPLREHLRAELASTVQQGAIP